MDIGRRRTLGNVPVHSGPALNPGLRKSVEDRGGFRLALRLIWALAIGLRAFNCRPGVALIAKPVGMGRRLIALVIGMFV